MEKGSMDLDFGEIAGDKKVTEAPKVERTQERKVEPLGYSITLATNTPGTYIYKDLAECTGEEFIQWASQVYPLGLKDVDAKEFESRQSKARAFQNILKFHQSSLFYDKKETKETYN